MRGAGTVSFPWTSYRSSEAHRRGCIPFCEHRGLGRFGALSTRENRTPVAGARSHLAAIAVRPDAPDLLRWVDTFLEAELIDLTAEELLQFGEREKLWP